MLENQMHSYLNPSFENQINSTTFAELQDLKDYVPGVSRSPRRKNKILSDSAFLNSKAMPPGLQPPGKPNLCRN